MMMKELGIPSVTLLMLLSVVNLSHSAIVYVSDTQGNVWKYDSVADMAGQNASTNTGTLVATHAAYAADQAATMDFSSGIVYRVTGSGDIVQYSDLNGYLTNSTAMPTIAGIYAGSNAINGASYDGATGGFYTVGASSSANPGDVARYTTLTAFLAGTPSSILPAPYNGNRFNFYDPDITQGTRNVSMPPLPDTVDAQYFQAAGNGRLEGFASIDEYRLEPNNRINVTGADAFGGNGPYVSAAAFAVPVPEPSASFLLLLGAVGGLCQRRSR